MTALAAGVVAGGEVVKAADDAISVIARLVGKLRAQPDIAALKLSAALDEIVKTYTVVDAAFTSYASLAIDENALTSRSQELLAIAGGSLSVQVAAGKGDCSKIRHIYEKHLSRWFEQVFNPKEQEAMFEAFMSPRGLGDADETLFRQLAQLASQLAEEAKRALSLVLAGDHNGARSAIWTTYEKLTPVQTQMAETMKLMYELKNEFIEIARAT